MAVKHILNKRLKKRMQDSYVLKQENYPIASIIVYHTIKIHPEKMRIYMPYKIHIHKTDRTSVLQPENTSIEITQVTHRIHPNYRHFFAIFLLSPMRSLKKNCLSYSFQEKNMIA